MCEKTTTERNKCLLMSLLIWVTTDTLNVGTQACKSHDHDHQWTDYAIV